MNECSPRIHESFYLVNSLYIAWQCLRIWRAGSMHNVSIAFLSWLVSVHYTRRLHRRRVVSPNVMHKPHVSDTPYDARDTRVNDSERALSAPRMRRADSNGGSDRVSAAWHMKSRNPYCWKTREVSHFFRDTRMSLHIRWLRHSIYGHDRIAILWV